MPRKRKTDTRWLKPRILILCEGEKTEPLYFKGLRADPGYSGLASVEIVVQDEEKNTARELVERAIELRTEANKERNPYAEVWVVVDRDGYTLHAQAFDQAAANTIFIAFSSICFEYWLVLHFKETTRAFAKCNDCIAYLKRNCLPGYEKRRDVYARLKDNIPQAIDRARRCRTTSPDVRNGVQPYQLNPFTNVDVLVRRLIHFDRLKDAQGRYRVLKMERGRPAPLGLGAEFDALCP